MTSEFRVHHRYCCHHRCRNILDAAEKQNNLPAEQNWETATHFLAVTSGSQAANPVMRLEAWCKSFLKWHFPLTPACHVRLESAPQHRGHWFTGSQTCVAICSVWRRMSAGDPGSCNNLGQVSSNTSHPQMNRFYLSTEPVNNYNNTAFHFRRMNNPLREGVWPPDWGTVPTIPSTPAGQNTHMHLVWRSLNLSRVTQGE